MYVINSKFYVYESYLISTVVYKYISSDKYRVESSWYNTMSLFSSVSIGEIYGCPTHTCIDTDIRGAFDDAGHVYVPLGQAELWFKMQHSIVTPN